MRLVRDDLVNRNDTNWKLIDHVRQRASGRQVLMAGKRVANIGAVVMIARHQVKRRRWVREFSGKHGVLFRALTIDEVASQQNGVSAVLARPRQRPPDLHRGGAAIISAHMQIRNLRKHEAGAHRAPLPGSIVMVPSSNGQVEIKPPSCLCPRSHPAQRRVRSPMATPHARHGRQGPR